MLYGAEMWAVQKVQEKKLDVAEILDAEMDVWIYKDIVVN